MLPEDYFGLCVCRFCGAFLCCKFCTAVYPGLCRRDNAKCARHNIDLCLTGSTTYFSCEICHQRHFFQLTEHNLEQCRLVRLREKGL